MKKIVALFVCTFLTTTLLFAQDIIVTNDAKKIEAKILEVSKSEIKYKELDNLDGPTFVLDVEDINTVIYANGKVVIHNQPSKSLEAPKIEQEHIVQEETKQYVIVDFDIERTSNPFWCDFINLSSGASDFRWDFGDGTFSFAPGKATRVYEKPGTYVVTLTANVGNQKYEQRKTLTIEGQGAAQQEEQEELQEQLDRLQQQAVESAALLGQSIKKVIDVKNSYALDIKNTTKYPYRINLDGHILGVVNPYKTERFIVSVEVYGRMQAVQTSGYNHSPNIKEFRIPPQKKQTACAVVIK